MALGMAWASRITSIGMSFVVPVFVGVLIDRWLKIEPIGAVIGVILGFVVSMLQIMRIAKTNSPK